METSWRERGGFPRYRGYLIEFSGIALHCLLCIQRIAAYIRCSFFLTGFNLCCWREYRPANGPEEARQQPRHGRARLEHELAAVRQMPVTMA